MTKDHEWVAEARSNNGNPATGLVAGISRASTAPLSQSVPDGAQLSANNDRGDLIYFMCLCVTGPACCLSMKTIGAALPSGEVPA